MKLEKHNEKFKPVDFLILSSNILKS